MPTTTENSVWEQEARTRWPHARLMGSGQYAVILCHGVIRLESSEMFARGMVLDRCHKVTCCPRTHNAFDLRLLREKRLRSQLAGRATSQVDRNTSDRERDRA